MKKRIYYLFPLFILLLFVVCSCKDDNNEPTPPEPSPEITIPSSENLNPVLSQESGTASISFTTTADWTASLVNTRAESWITVTPNSGSKGKNEITITATTNETYDERNATVVLKCGSDSKNIVVTQKQKDALTVTSSKYEVASKGGNISVEVKANINFEVEVRADWIKQQTEKTRALTTSNLNFTIEPNETGDKREGEIIIKSGELSETIKVYQGFEDFITLTKKDFTIPEEGGNVDIEIKSTLDYEVKMLSDVDWITEIQSRAVSTHTHHYTVSPNDTYDSREAKIVFYNPKDENVADTVSIYQMYKGAILVARNEYQFGIDGGTLNLAVQTNLEFDVEVSDTWIQQVQPTRALTEYNLSFAISKNTEQKDREGTITVKDKNSDKKQVVTIKQSRIDLEREALIALYKATNGDNWTNNTNWCSDKPITEWYGIHKVEDSLYIALGFNNLKGFIPKEIGKLTNLHTLDLQGNNLSGEIPKEIGNLKQLVILRFAYNQLTGNIPEEIGFLENLEIIEIQENNLSGRIFENLGNLKKLKSFYAQLNQLEGNIDQSVGHLKELKELLLSSNNLSGNIPEGIWNLGQLEIIGLRKNSFLGELPKETKLTKLKSLDLGYNNLSGSIPEWIADLPLLKSCNLAYNFFSGAISTKITQTPNWNLWAAEYSIIPQKNDYNLLVDYYTSTDFSKDGEVVILQTHTKGKGIKLVLIGDLFLDTDMDFDGVYEMRMKEAMEIFFSIEPTKSLQELFDVICIKAVSKNNYLGGETALSTNTTKNGIWTFEFDSDNVRKYVQKAIGMSSLNDVLTIMVINSYVEAHSCCHYLGNNFNVACCQLNRETSTIQAILHEANGHGFGLLHDEYRAYEQETIPENEIEIRQREYENAGYWANIDFTNDPKKVKWAHFILDPRYAAEEIGVYEGALWGKGIYRPTKNESACSIMDGGLRFNAPSREAIYKRAMKLAYGDSWTYDYEEFVKFDEPGRAECINTNTRSVNKKIMKDYKHIPPKIFNYPAVAK